MIVKEREPTNSKDPRSVAGDKAEEQMAFYLHRAFRDDPGVLVLNNLRIVDPAHPEFNGSTDASQIDHLVLHRWGAFIIESKSVSGTVSVRDDGSGGDEWMRIHAGKQAAFASPIQQAKRQGDVLRAFLQSHREKLRGKMSVGLRTINKLLNGTDQMGFKYMPIQIIVAISDEGIIQRVGQWKEPETPYRTFVCKADLVPDKIRGEMEHHGSLRRSILDEHKRDYGLWTISDEELHRVANFLRDNHTPRSHTHQPAATPPARTLKADVPQPSRPSTPRSSQRTLNTSTPSPSPRITPQAAVCRDCAGSDLVAMWGQYGYYWKCACGVNTPIPTICHNCNAQGTRGTNVRIRKDGPDFFRSCDLCGVQQRIWTNPASPERK